MDKLEEISKTLQSIDDTLKRLEVIFSDTNKYVDLQFDGKPIFHQENHDSLVIENRGEKMKRTISDECMSKVDELIVYIADNIKSDITENKMNYEDEMPKKVMALAKLISARAEWN